jgi:hypothetical protein
MVLDSIRSSLMSTGRARLPTVAAVEEEEEVEEGHPATAAVATAAEGGEALVEIGEIGEETVVGAAVTAIGEETVEVAVIAVGTAERAGAGTPPWLTPTGTSIL